MQEIFYDASDTRTYADAELISQWSKCSLAAVGDFMKCFDISFTEKDWIDWVPNTIENS